MTDKLYLGRAIDRCRWKDQDCAFKRIEFDSDVEGIDREIKTRESLLRVITSQGEAKVDKNKIMERQFNVIPILAVVVDEQGRGDGNVIGIVMPFGGISLESLSDPDSSSTDPLAGTQELEVTVENYET